MNTTHEIRLATASLIGLAVLGGGVMSTASASMIPTPHGSVTTMPPSHDPEVNTTYSTDGSTKTVTVRFYGGGSQTTVYSAEAVGYTVDESTRYRGTTEAVTNVRVAPSTSSKIVGKVKAGVALKGETSTNSTTDLKGHVLASTSTGRWMRITSGTYAGKYVDTSVLKKVVSLGTKVSRTERTEWVLTSTTTAGEPTKIGR